MNNLAVVWTPDKYQELAAQLTGFWAEDIWDMRNCPISTRPLRIDEAFHLKFFCPSITVNNEIKYAIWRRITDRKWNGLALASSASPLLKWFSKDFPAAIYSLTQKSITEWEALFVSYLTKQGRAAKQRSYSYLSKTRGTIYYYSPITAISVLRKIYKVVSNFYDTRSEYEKDIWELGKLGINRFPAYVRRSINFNTISQFWLRDIVKKFLRYGFSVYSQSQCFSIMTSLNEFSAFLKRHYPNILASTIDRSVIVEYLAHLASRDLFSGTKADRLTDLRLFLETCAREGWASFPKERIIYSEDLPKTPKFLPRFIPDDVLNQLFQYLGDLPVHFQRMTRILYEVGMRVSELSSLPYNCLMQDNEGSWWIRYYQSKFKQEHTQPVSAEIAAIIQAQQQQAARKSETPRLLFPNSKGNHFPNRHLADALNRLAIEKNICDSTGKIWWFETHQFRHTFGTRLINNGVPHHIVQRLMGHKSADMTSRYAHIHDQSLKQEYEKSLSKRKLIDISGRVITEITEADAIEFQWLKKHIDARTLPNGYCGIPLALSPCPHPNACLTCPHFRTDQSFLHIHQQQLEDTHRLVQISRINGWTIQIENNEIIVANLQKIIASLKEASHDASTQC